MLAFALDENRALAFKRDGAPCIASIRKLRLDSSDEELVLDDVSLKAGSTVHVYVASNRLSGSCAYDVLAESDAELEELPEPTGGYRGVEHPIKERTSGERVLCVDGGGARGVVPLAVLAECERETRTSIRDQFDLFAGTSTGAIVAFGLAIAELPVAVFQRLYDDLVRLIFGSKNLNAQQRQRRLQAVLEAVFGADSTLHGRKRSRQGPGRGDGRRRRSVKALRLPVLRTTGGRTTIWWTREPTRCELWTFGGGGLPRGASTPTARRDGCWNYRVHLLCGNQPSQGVLVGDEVRIVDWLRPVTSPPCGASTSTARTNDRKILLDGALVANNPTQFALAEAASLRRRKNRAKAVGKEDAQLDLVVSLGTGSAPARATSSSGAEVLGLLSAFANLAAARDFVSGIIDLLTDTDATHDLVRRQLRDTWPSLIQERYHRLDAVVDARHLGLAEGDAECLRDLRAMALDYIKRERGLEWRHLVDALQRRSGGGTQRVYAVVDLDEESMQVAKPHRAGLMRPVRKKFARATGLHGFFSKKGRS